MGIHTEVEPIREERSNRIGVPELVSSVAALAAVTVLAFSASSIDVEDDTELSDSEETIEPDSIVADPKYAYAEVTQNDKGEWVVLEDVVGINLGSDHNWETIFQEIQISGLMDTLKERADIYFVLSWKGGKVPRGVEILGREIAGTQNGMVVSTQGLTLGLYDRLVEHGGKDGDEQLMFISAFKEPYF